MKRIEAMYRKHEESISYLLFGGLTTVVNFVLLYFCKWAFHTSDTVSNIIAWIVSVAFAFFTNKFFVFKSENTAFEVLAKEMFDFAAARLLTGAIETGAVWLFVERMEKNLLLIKVIMAIFVILSNYVISKLIIFKTKPTDKSSADENPIAER